MTQMDFVRPIGRIVEVLRNAKRQGKGCTLLVGAGCSTSAGIPTADEFVGIIKEKYYKAYSRAKKKWYADCMAELSPGERHSLIAEYVDKAKINWAHICIAILIKEGYVDRVLTTNFDPLIVRACALLWEFPAVYDFATSSKYFNPSSIHKKAIFYLHGQRGGFRLLNTKAEINKLSRGLSALLNEVKQGRVWIVVGYSGKNDPVFKQLATINCFDEGLYWVGFQSPEPPVHVRNKLLRNDKYVFYTNCLGSDSFLISLTQKLKIFPPGFINKPFTHLSDMLEKLATFHIPGQTFERDGIRIPSKWIKDAIEQFEKGSDAIALEALYHLIAGNYANVVELSKQFDKQSIPAEIVEPLSSSYEMLGQKLLEKARTKKGEEAAKLLVEAKENYVNAYEGKPDFPAAYNLACISASLKDENECREWLERSIRHNRITLGSMAEDQDFQDVREKEWFKDLLRNKKMS